MRLTPIQLSALIEGLGAGSVINYHHQGWAEKVTLSRPAREIEERLSDRVRRR